MEVEDGISGDYEGFSVHFSFFFAPFSVSKQTTSPERWSLEVLAITGFGHFVGPWYKLRWVCRGAYYPRPQISTQISNSSRLQSSGVNLPCLGISSGL